MNKHVIGGLSLRLPAALVVGLMLCPPAWAKDTFPLASAVPGDVFLCDVGRHNPERDFIDQYWGEVFAAVEESGLGGDLWALIGSLVGETQTEVERLKELGTKLLEGVDWGEFGGEEHACAMRMPKLNESMTTGGAEILAVLRETEAGAAKNFAGLVAMLDTLIAEITKATGNETIKVEKTSKMGAEVASLYPPEGLGAPHYGLAIAHKGDLIIVAIGDTILDDSLGLLSGQGQAKPVSANPRFKAAFKDLPEAEDGMTFFDMQRMLADIRAITEEVFPIIEAASSGPEDRIINNEETGEVAALHAEFYKAHKKGDYQQGLELLTQAVEKDPKSSGVMYDLACVNALLGNKEEALTWVEKSVNGGFYAPKHIAGDSDLAGLRDDPRFEAALANAAQKAAEIGGEQGEDKMRLVKVLVDRVMGLMGMLDYSASVRHVDGHSTYQDEITVLSPGASQDPFYPVFGRRRPLTNFERFLPQETVSFSLGGGIDLMALYKYLEDSVRAVGPNGEKLLAQWEGIQQSIDFNVQKDLLSWIDGDSITVTIRQDGTEATVWMIKVNDEAAAGEKLTAALDWVSKSLPEIAASNPALAPMMAMVGVRTSPATHEALEGFTNVYVGMFPPAVCGVKDGYLMAGTSADAVALCLATAAGKHPNIRQNERVMREALVPEGGFREVSLTDRRNLGKEIAEVLMGIAMASGMMGAFIPEPEVQQVITQCAGMIGKLGPAAAKIDFYKSSASYTTFDGKAWHKRCVTNYASPAERRPGPAEEKPPAAR